MLNRGDGLKEDALKEVYLTVPMLHDMELAVSKTAEALSGSMNFKPDQIDEIKQALIEACINAIEHSRSRDRHIYILFQVYANRLEIRITDRGTGFDRSKIQTPSIQSKIFTNKRKRGWGLLLMRHYMDHVEIDSGPSGTSIVMTKEIHSPIKEDE
jgi:serine/threonine-protein kinase RsbW